VNHLLKPRAMKAARQAASRDQFAQAVAEGLARRPRSLPCKYFYDERGSRLFDAICELDEYYPTRAELEIMDRHADAMATQLGEQVMLVEFGSGSSVKTRVLLHALRDPVAYVPLDISRDHLLRTAEQLGDEFPHIEILPLVADFTGEFTLPQSRRRPSHRAVYFPGSTIGNLLPQRASELLARIARTVDSDGGLLIGIDLQKDPAIIEAAYNDSKGVTAEFNKNLLRRINRELDGDFDLDRFRHRAVYNESAGRVEISLVSLCDQTIRVGNSQYQFGKGESILTEYSHKYTVEQFAGLASRAGFVLRQSWTDSGKLFAVLHLVHRPRLESGVAQ
jgi:dimethylhistidine N-methyltransferase